MASDYGSSYRIPGGGEFGLLGAPGMASEPLVERSAGAEGQEDLSEDLGFSRNRQAVGPPLLPEHVDRRGSTLAAARRSGRTPVASGIRIAPGSPGASQPAECFDQPPIVGGDSSRSNRRPQTSSKTTKFSRCHRGPEGRWPPAPGRSPCTPGRWPAPRPDAWHPRGCAGDRPAGRPPPPGSRVAASGTGPASRRCRSSLPCPAARSCADAVPRP
jgi:hypothetical protein